MKVTVDTNILISSTFWGGDSDKILKKVERGELELILSEDILDEFLKVLDYEEIKKKIENKNLEMRRAMEKIVSISTIVVPLRKLDVVEDDPDDNKILECAVEGDVDYLISQDKHLLNIGEYEGIKIISPEEFLKVFEGC